MVVDVPVEGLSVDGSVVAALYLAVRPAPGDVAAWHAAIYPGRTAVKAGGGGVSHPGVPLEGGVPGKRDRLTAPICGEDGGRRNIRGGLK